MHDVDVGVDIRCSVTKETRDVVLKATIDLCQVSCLLESMLLSDGALNKQIAGNIELSCVCYYSDLCVSMVGLNSFT